MEFKKYSSLENSYRQPYINKCEHALPSGLDTLCQVTEKIHGANFSVYLTAESDSDPVKIRYAKRTSFCDEYFNSCGEVMREYEDGLRGLYDFLGCKEVIIYGEIAGKGIQKGIEYGDKDFWAFDIKVDGSFIDTDYVESLCRNHGIKHVPVLKDEITLRDALLMDETFKSKVKEDVEGDNFAEGFVIKPIEPAYLGNGARIAIKQKSKKFEEVGGNKVKVRKPVEPLCKIDIAIVNDVSFYITENRLRNVLSKEGTPNHKEFGKIAGLLAQDAREDFEKDRDISIKSIAQEYTRVSKEIMKIAVSLTRGENGSTWVQICEGEF